MSLIIVLSVFNGFESLVISLYNSFDPDIKITPLSGKSFQEREIKSIDFHSVPGISHVTKVLEENALLKYKDKQYIATIKGVSPEFFKMTRLDTMLVEGSLMPEKNETQFAVAGQGVAYFLGLIINDRFNPLSVYVPRKGNRNSMLPEDAFNNLFLNVNGVFSIQQDFDAKYVIVPISYVEKLLESKGSLSALEIGLQKNADMNLMAEVLKEKLGPGFKVSTKYQQHELLYKIMQSEKWAVFLILSFILLIATFNVISSITMLIIDKQKDATILWSMGAGINQIRRIFMLEGLMITLSGAIGGLVLGFLVCLAQMKFGFVKLGGSGSFVIDAYPVKMEGLDFVYVFITVLVIGIFAAWFPAKKIIKPEIYSSETL
jgi:lipoprotein-releasing system permease protein